ncbi:hypothetical protein [Candidatus Nitrosopumilus sediminis]|nr:hypothetical protein [Candidatus Nitrosopumilus sediminis]
MKAITILKKAVHEEYPNFKNYHPEEQTQIINTVLSSYILPVIKKIKLPNLISLQFKIKQEAFLENRRRKATRKDVRQINYALWKLIYDAKSSLISDSLQTSQNYPVDVVNDNTTFTIRKYSDETFTKIVDPTSDSSENAFTVLDPPLTLSSTLEEKVLSDESYKMFVSKIDVATRSTPVKHLGVAEYYLEEKQDRYQQSLLKIILYAKFLGGDNPTKIIKWEKLRDIIDSYFDSIAKTPKLQEMIDNFYVKLRP